MDEINDPGPINFRRDDRVQVEADPRLLEAAQSIGCILECLGYAVFVRMLPLNVVDDLMGGTVRVAWRKLRPYVEYERERTASQKTWEWSANIAPCVRKPHSDNAAAKNAVTITTANWRRVTTPLR